MVVGFILILGSIALLGWNEGNYINTKKDIEDTRGEYKEIGCNLTMEGLAAEHDVQVDSVVWFNCDAAAYDLKDPSIPPGSDDNITATFVERDVQVYQWAQSCTQQKESGGQRVTCTYSTPDYHRTPLSWDNCDRFSGSERSSCNSKLSDNKRWAKGFGTFPLTSGRFPSYCNESDAATCTGCAGDVTGGCYWQAGGYAIPGESLEAIDDPGLTPLSTELYRGALINYPGSSAASDDDAPVFGPGNSSIEPRSMKLSWQQSTFTRVSVIGTLKTTGDGSPATFAVQKRTNKIYIVAGDRSAEEMLDDDYSANESQVIILRIVGWLIMWIGAGCLFAPATVLVDQVPCVGSMLGDLAEEMICCLTCPCTAACALLFIAIFWLFYRPIVAVVMLAICLALAGVFFFAYGGSKGLAGKPEEDGDKPNAAASVPTTNDGVKPAHTPNYTPAPTNQPGQCPAPATYPPPAAVQQPHPPPTTYPPLGQYPPAGQYPPPTGQQAYPPPTTYPPQPGQYPPPTAQQSYPPSTIYSPPAGQYPPPAGQYQYPPQQQYPPSAGLQKMESTI